MRGEQELITLASDVFECAGVRLPNVEVADTPGAWAAINAEPHAASTDARPQPARGGRDAGAGRHLS